jgi:thiamine thiazole synthase
MRLEFYQEDQGMKENAVKGVVINNAAIEACKLLVDPFCMGAHFVVDATGHSAAVVSMLKTKKADLQINELQEVFMDVDKAEAKVVEKTSEVCTGLYVAGMSVCSSLNLPRTVLIFSGMLKSGKRVAQLINERL